MRILLCVTIVCRGARHCGYLSPNLYLRMAEPFPFDLLSCFFHSICGSYSFFFLTQIQNIFHWQGREIVHKKHPLGDKDSSHRYHKYVWVYMDLTFLLLRWMSPIELARLLGPSRVVVLWGQSTVTRLCSPIRTLRIFSAPVTRMSGRPSRWVLNTFPYFCLLDAWKPAPWKREPGARRRKYISCR